MIARERPEVAKLADLGAEPRVYHVASGVTLEDYLEFYAEQYCEYVEGEVYREMPIRDRHEQLRMFLLDLLRVYFIKHAIGQVRWEPTMMFQPEFPRRRREPDIMIVFDDGQAVIEESQINGAADIVIEIVSPASIKVDRVDKFSEYEQSGVREYWLFDFMRQDAQFFRLASAGVFQLAAPDANSVYETPLLPRFRLPVPTLWQEKLPDILEAMQLVEAMFAE